MIRWLFALLLAGLVLVPVPVSGGQIYVPATVESLTVSGQTIGDLIYADSTSSFTRLADVATGNALISGGVGAAPSWGKVGLTTHVSGTLAYGSGGTGATSFATSNCLVRAQAAAFDCSTLSYDGTDITQASGQYLSTAGGVAATAAQFSHAGDANSGFGFLAADVLGLAAGGVWYLRTENGVTSLRTANPLRFASGANLDTAVVAIMDNAAGVLEINSGTGGTFRDLKHRTTQWAGANGEYARLTPVMESHTLSLAATSDTANLFPANSIGLGVSIRVTTAITGCATLDVGVAGATTRYGTGIALTSGTTNVSAGTTNPTIYAAATPIRFTCVGGGASFTAGVIRVTVHYFDLSAPTS